MICELCKGKGWIQGQAPDIPTACSACGGKGFVDMTNEEWRKTCSIEEFAEWISNLVYACMRCGMSNGKAYCHIGYCIQDEEDAEKWLKEKHDE